MKIPKTGNILIPTIAKKIEEKQKQLNLNPEISITEFLKKYKEKKHRYFSPCKDRKGKKVAFYARLHFNLDTKRKTLKEINFLNKLKKSNLKIKKAVPEIIDFGVEKDFEWFIRKYPSALPLGKSRHLIQKIKTNLIPQLIKIIREIPNIPPSFLPKIEKFKVENYLAESLYQGLVKEGLMEKKVVENLQDFIKKHLPLLKKENKYFCHGDLNLGNILLAEKKFWIIDWELIHLNNFAFDIAYLWAHFWEAKRSFRQKLISSFLKNLSSEKIEKFKIFFPIVISYLALGGIRHKLKNRRMFYSNLLKNSLNFEKLIKQ